MSTIEAMDEHERSELVRNWIRQNGGSVAIGILAGLGMILGYQHWQANRRAHAEDGQMQYQALTKAIEAKNDESADKILGDLQKRFGDSAYGVFANLNQAQREVSKGDLEAAAKALEAVRDRPLMPAIKDVANLRLARVRLGLGQYDAALLAAQAVQGSGFKSLAAELKGDALVGLNRADEARKSYEDALTSLDANSPGRELIEMKRDDASAVPMAAAPVAPAAPTAPAAPIAATVTEKGKS